MSDNFRNFIDGISLIPNNAVPSGLVKGDMYVSDGTLSPPNTLNFHNGTSASAVLTITHSATLLNSVQNKDLDSSSVRFVGIGSGGTNLSNPSALSINVNGGAVNTATTLDFNQTVNRTITFPDITDTVVTLTASQNLTNKTFNAYSAYFPPAAPTANTALVYDGTVYKWSSAAGGDAAGSNDDIISTQYQARILDTFEQAGSTAANTASTINSTIGQTTANWDSVLQLYKIEYDNTLTVTGTAGANAPYPNDTRMTFSGAGPAYPTQSMAVGDMLVIKSTGEARRIVNIVSNTVVDVESAFTSLPGAGTACMVSETVSTFDIYGSAFDGAPISQAFTATPTFQSYLVDYQDAAGISSIYTPNATPVIAFSASNDNTVWSVSALRPTLPTTQIDGKLFPTAGSAFYVRLFANPNITPAASGTASLIEYRGYMQLYPQAVTYSINQAYAKLNGTLTPYQCTVSHPLKTRITLNWPYAFGTTSGLPYGAIDVYINGQFIPKFVAGVTDSTAAYYTEISSTVIELDQNYSATPYSIQIVQRGNI